MLIIGNAKIIILTRTIVFCETSKDNDNRFIIIFIKYMFA